MYYLVYSSTASETITHHHLTKILQSSHRNNPALGVTGMLLYCKGKFIQVLEGERDTIHGLYLKIVKNLLHTDAHVLLEGRLSSRNFSSWTMGYKELEETELLSISGLESIDNFFKRTDIDENSHPALLFLKLFYIKNQSDHLQYL